MLLSRRFSRLKWWITVLGAIFALLTITWAQAQGGGIAYGQTASGTLKAGATDTWHFSGSVGDVIALKAERISGDLEPVVMLQDPAQQPVAGTQAAGGQGTISLMQVRLAQSGSYQVGVSGNGKTSGAYHLTLALSQPATQPVTSAANTPNPASTTANAGDIPFGASEHGELNDKIYSQLWHFRGNFGDVLDIKMVRQSGNLNPVLALISPIGEIIAASDSLDGGVDASILGYQLPFTGSYTIIARRAGNNLGATGNTSGSYELSVSSRGPNTTSLNTILIPSTAVQGRLNVNAPLALYRMENGGALAVWLDLGSLHRVAHVRILDTTGDVLSSLSGLSPLNLPLHLPDKGPFLVEVSSQDYDNQPFADFSLTVFRLSANIAANMNNSSAMPQPLHYGDQRQSTISSAADEWFFQGHTGDMISLGITPDRLAIAEATGTSIRVSGPGDAVLFQGTLGPGLRQVYSLATTGLYEVEVRPASAASQTPGSANQPTTPVILLPYQIDLERTGANRNSFSPIALAPDRGPLALDAPTNGTLKVGDSDSWWLDATAGQVVNLTLLPTSANTPLGLALERPDGSPIDVQVTERLQGAIIQQAVLDQTGRYRVVVFDSQRKNGGQYVLRYEEATGGALRAGQPVKGIATPANGYSAWTLDVAAGSLINLRVNSLTPKSWTPSVSIADPNGQLIGSSGSTSELLGVVAPLTGRYTVVVGGQVTGTLASYDLLANVQLPFAGEAGAPIQISTTLPPLPRYGVAASDSPVHIGITGLINTLAGTDKQSLDKGQLIKPGNAVRGEIGRGTYSQAWKFDVAQNQSVSITATSLAGDSGPDLMLLDADGKALHEQLHGEDSTTVLTYRIPQPGSYRIVVRMGLNGGRYLISLNTTQSAPGPLQIASGSPLVYGQTVPGEIPAGAGADQYFFLGAAGDTVTIRLTRATGDLAPALHLLSPSGVEIASDANPGGAPAGVISSFQLADNGVFTVVAQRADSAPKSAGRYFLDLNAEGGFHLGSRAGGIITPGASVIGQLVSPDNQDTWLLRGHSGERVNLILTGLGDPQPAPLGLRLQDTTGKTFVAQDESLTQGALRLSDIVLPADGIYRVQAVGGNTTAGIYSLTWEPDQQPITVGPLSYSQTVGGVFNASHNVDSWVFSGTAGDVVSVALDYERGDQFSGALQVRSENGLPLVTVAASGVSARADNLLLPFSGSYTVVVANPDNSFKGNGVYSLSVVLRDSKARSMGGILRYGQQASGDLYVDDPTDTWVFGAHAGDVVKLSARATDQFLKPSLDLKTPTGNVLASAQADSADKTGQVKLNDFKITADGVYVVTIGGGNGKTTGSYLLSLDYSPPPVAENAVLSYGDSKEGLIANDRPHQGFAFSGREGDTVSVQVMREAGARLAPIVSIQSEDGHILARADANGGDSATIKDFKLPDTGHYNLVVSRYLEEQGKTSGRFTINLTGAPQDRPIKSTVNYGQQVLGRLSDQTPLERVNFAGKAGDVIAVTSHATSGDLDTQLTLQDANETVLAFNDDANGPDAQIGGILLTADGTYTVTISRAGTRTVGGSGNYEMFINRTYQVAPTAAPTTLIAYGQRVVSTVDAAAPEARYTFSGNQDDRVSVQIVHQTDDAPPLLTIVDPANEVLAQGKLAIGQTTIDEYKLPVSGLYTISVRRPLDAKQSYSPFALTLTLLSSPANPAGAMTAVQSAAGGIIRLSESVTGDFKAGQNANYWLFEANAGQIISVNVLGLTAKLSPEAILIGPNGNAVTSLSSATGDQSPAALSLKQFRLPFDGVYTLLILPGAQAQIGQYRLTVQPNNAIAPAPLALAAGQTVNGTLDASQPEQIWTVVGQAGQAITARMLVTSGTLVPSLQLVNSSNQVIAEGHVEQNTQGRADNVLTLTLPAPGTYTLIASAGDGNSGTYRLSLEMGALSPQAAAASPLVYGQSVHKAIEQGGADYWSFNGSAGDAVSASVTADNGKAPGVVLQDAAGRVLTQVAASDAAEQDITGIALPGDGKYVIALQGASTTTYTLTIQRRQNLLDDKINPRPLSVGQPLDGALTPDQTVNSWSFNAKAGDVIQIDATRLNGDVRPDIAVYSPKSIFITSAIADAATGNAKVGPLRVAEDGRYLIVATRSLGSPGKMSGRYTLVLTNPTGVSVNGGGTIPSYGKPVIGAIVAPGDTDTWSFNGQAGEVLNIRMTRTGGTLIPALKLVGQDGKEIASVKAAKDEALVSSIVVPLTGQYSVTANRADDKSSGTYQLVIERVQSALQASMARAEGISFGEEHSGTLTADVPARAYVFFAKAGTRITAEVKPGTGSSLDLYAVILAPDGTTLAADDNSGEDKSARIASLLLPADGFYGIVVTGSPVQQATQQVGAFTVSLQRDQPGAAYQGNITVGAAANGTLRPDQPVQEWTFQAGAGQTIAASVSSTSTLFDVVLIITSQDGKLLARSSPSLAGSASVEAALPGPGAYAVLISSNARGAAGRYQLGVSYALAPSGGGALISGEAVSGSISDGDFTDTWRFSVNPNATLNIDLARQSGDLDLDLALYAPDGKAVQLPSAASKGPEGNKTIQLQGLHLSAGGTYILVVSRAGGATGRTSGDYQLKVTMNG